MKNEFNKIIFTDILSKERKEKTGEFSSESNPVITEDIFNIQNLNNQTNNNVIEDINSNGYKETTDFAYAEGMAKLGMVGTILCTVSAICGGLGTLNYVGGSYMNALIIFVMYIFFIFLGFSGLKRMIEVRKKYEKENE